MNTYSGSLKDPRHAFCSVPPPAARRVISPPISTQTNKMNFGLSRGIYESEMLFRLNSCLLTCVTVNSALGCL